MAVQRVSVSTKTLGGLALLVVLVLLHRNSAPRKRNMALGAVQSSTVQVNGRSIHFLAVNNVEPRPATTVVLLHGQAFQAATWNETGTLEALDQHGVRALAIDLPGHGATGGQPLPAQQRGAFLQGLLEALRVSQPLVLVTPSMSGSYALPWLASHAGDLRGWVAVAPAGLKQWLPQGALAAAADQPQLKVLAVYGEQDGMRPDYALLEEALPRAQLLLIPRARHACYLDNPQAFNAGLLRFLDGEVAPLRR